MILHLFLAFATSPTETSEDVPATPDTSCTIAASVPEADAADVPRNTGVVLYLEGGGCYELQTATFVHDGVLASSEPVDAHWPFASAFHDFSPGDWTLVLSSTLGDLTFAFQVVDVIESAPSSPHVQLERAHRTDGSVDIRLQLSVDAEPDTRLLIIESESGARRQVLTDDTLVVTFDQREETSPLCVEVSARGVGAAWSEPNRLCIDVLVDPRPFVHPTGAGGCSSAGSTRLLGAIFRR